jgi:DNA-binding PadR family transcriptional regulator
MLELAVLGLLKEQELHGYELKKRLSETPGQFWGVSFGSLYPALAKLEAAGAVKAVEASVSAVPPAPIPMTGSLKGELTAFRTRRAAVRDAKGRGKARKVYGITDEGERLFVELLASDTSSTDDGRLFNLKLAFARHLDPEARLGLLRRRRAQLVQRLDRGRTGLRGGRQRLDTYTRSLLEHGTEATERDISWLDRLIAAEQHSSGTQEDLPTP